jgi:hypothetical protein
MPLLPPVHLSVIALAACFELGFVRSQSIRCARRLLHVHDPIWPRLAKTPLPKKFCVEIA